MFAKNVFNAFGRALMVAAILFLTVLALVQAPPARAAAFSDYLENKVTDWMLRGQAFTAPATTWVSLIVVNRGYWAASTVYATNDFLLPITPNGRLYKLTSAGCTSGGSQPTWPTTAAGTVVDNTCTWTEQTTALEAGSFPEVSGGSYGRISVTSSLANWAGTQSSGSTVASSGASGTTSNNNAITFAAPTANWGVIFGTYIMDASTAGNGLIWTALSVPKTVNNGDSAPSFPAASLTVQIDN